MGLVAHWPLINNLDNLIDITNPLIKTDSNYPKKASQIDNYNPRFYDSYANPYIDENSFHTGSVISKKKLNLGNSQSMFCWVNIDKFYGEGKSYLTAACGQHRYKKGTGMGITFRYCDDDHGYLAINTGEGTGEVERTYNRYTTTATLETKSWYHVGFTFEAGYISLYINGVQQSLQVWDNDGGDTANATACNTNRYTDSVLQNMAISEDWFGAFFWSFAELSDSSPYSSYYLPGMMNDIRVYDHALSPFEVMDIYKGLYCHYNFDSLNSSVIRDNSGFQNDSIHHTLTSLDFTDIAKGRCSAVFNNSYLACPVTCKLPAPLTYNIWAYMDNWASYLDPNKTSTESSDYSMRILSCTENGGFNIECPAKKSTIQFSIFDKARNEYQVIDTNIAWSTLGQKSWHMFSAVITDSVYTVYIDAQPKGSVTLGGSGLKYNSDNTIFLGCEAGGSSSSPDTTHNSYYFNGKIGDFKIYSSALSHAQLLDEYKTRGILSSTSDLKADTLIEGSAFKINNTGIFNNDVVVENDYLYFKNAKFLKIFEHDLRVCKSYFTSKEAAKGYNQVGKLSRLNEIKDYYYASNEGYEFLLTYPEINEAEGSFKYNRWKQTTNPLDSSTIEGYKVVHLDMQTMWGQGMRISSSGQALLDCNYGLTTWYGAIGQLSEWKPGHPFPSPASSGDGVSAVQLYIRVFDNDVNPIIKEVPIEYQEIEYLESTGTQWINTGNKIDHTSDSWELKFQTTDANGAYFILGVGLYEAGDFWLYQYNDSANNIHKLTLYTHDKTPTQHELFIKEPPSTEVGIVKYAEGTVFLNGTAISSLSNLSTFPTTTRNPVALFTSYGTTNWMSRARIYYYWEKNAEGWLMCDLVPCIRTSDGVPGMYDRRRGYFRENQGTGQFIAGPLKSGGEIFTTSEKMQVLYCNTFIEG